MVEYVPCGVSNVPVRFLLAWHLSPWAMGVRAAWITTGSVPTFTYC